MLSYQYQRYWERVLIPIFFLSSAIHFYYEESPQSKYNGVMWK